MHFAARDLTVIWTSCAWETHANKKSGVDRLFFQILRNFVSHRHGASMLQGFHKAQQEIVKKVSGRHDFEKNCGGQTHVAFFLQKHSQSKKIPLGKRGRTKKTTNCIPNAHAIKGPLFSHIPPRIALMEKSRFCCNLKV